MSVSVPSRIGNAHPCRRPWQAQPDRGLCRQLREPGRPKNGRPKKGSFSRISMSCELRKSILLSVSFSWWQLPNNSITFIYISLVLDIIEFIKVALTFLSCVVCGRDTRFWPLSSCPIGKSAAAVEKKPYLVAAWASSQSVSRLYYGSDNLNLAARRRQRTGAALSVDDIGGESEDMVAILGTL
jgi:hypothetical protein